MGRPRNVFSFQGEISGIEYLAWGVLFFAIKYPVDWLVATVWFGKTWSPFSYFLPVANPLYANAATLDFWAVMIAVSCPFIWIGLALTVQRLRTLGVPLPWAFVFFVPFVRMMFFALLVLLQPAADGPATDTTDAAAPPLNPLRRTVSTAMIRAMARPKPVPPAILDSLIPRGKYTCMLAAFLYSVATSLIVYALCTQMGAGHGNTVMLGVPFLLGYLTVAMIEHRRPLTFLGAIGTAWLSVLVCIGIPMCITIIGIYCALMVLPIAFFLAGLGAAVAHLTRTLASMQTEGKVLCVGLLPLLLLHDVFVSIPRPGERSVVSVVAVGAAPEVVWKNVVSFPPIRDEVRPGALFRLLALPRLVRAEIAGSGVGARRRCVFDTGVFVEPIEVWEPGRELTFGVVAQPGHLDRDVRVHRGQFKLSRNPDGTTRLEGTTWFSVTIWPQWYWTAWVDAIIHAIHLRALDHIKGLSEGRARVAPRSGGA
jgi:uncharacterized membrane protein YhaH (DUF805 family)